MRQVRIVSMFFSFCIVCLVGNKTMGQGSEIVQELGPETEDLIQSYEQITLDGKVAFRNVLTDEIIDQSAYLQLSGIDSASFVLSHPPIYSDDYWLSDRINPYKDVRLKTPFKITFDQESFTHPVNGDIVKTSRFGRRRRGPHRGLDIDLVTGDQVYSILPGKVRFVGYSRGHGKTIVVRHANEIETVYAHLSSYDVKINDVVVEGQAIGKGGNTGNSRGSHLHLEIRYKGVCIHPEYVLNFDGSRQIRSGELWVTNAWKTPRFHSSYKSSDVTPLLNEEDAIASEKAEPRYHKVRRGDTLSHLSIKYHLGVRDICKLNKISRKSVLRIGQILQVR